ncbi:MAG: hypothetical protein NTW45_10390 [Rhodocyclales bacterium]|nr:hypothetical protein [Rhodocyclales bacterium]
MAVAAIVAVLMLAAFAKMAMQDMARTTAKAATGGPTLSTIDSALVAFVMQNRRLPCPADGTIATGAANAGVEQRNAITGACIPANQSNGIAPWVTLGLPESAALDSYGNRVTYRVHPGLTASFANVPVPGPYNAMDMTNCSAGNVTAQVAAQVNTLATTYSQCTTVLPCTSCSAGCSGLCSGIDNVLLNNGLPVTDGSGNWLNQPSALTPTGAAYVLIAHGQNAAGAYTTLGALSPGSGVVGTSEALNSNGVALMTGSVVNLSYRDAPHNDTQTAQHFDDVTLHPKILDVLTRANLKPRK